MTQEGKPRLTKEATEALTRKFTILISVLAALFIFATLLVMALKKYSIMQSVIYNLEALAFMIHEPSGILRAFQIFMAIIGGFILWWVLWSLFDVVVEDSFMDYIQEVKIHKRLKKMKNHYVIAGGGKVGDGLANRLTLEKKQFVIIESDPERIKTLKIEKFNVVKGDSTDIDILRKAKLDCAKVLIIASHNTEKNLLVTLLAKELNPGIKIFARADNANVVNILEKAGVKKVVVPEIATVDQFMIDLDASDKEDVAERQAIESRIANPQVNIPK
jgi:voltage-gated potassium channel